MVKIFEATTSSRIECRGPDSPNSVATCWATCYATNWNFGWNSWAPNSLNWSTAGRDIAVATRWNKEHSVLSHRNAWTKWVLGQLLLGLTLVFDSCNNWFSFFACLTSPCIDTFFIPTCNLLAKISRHLFKMFPKSKSTTQSFMCAGIHPIHLI